MAKQKTIIEKIWERHIVHEEEGKPDLLYIDQHLIHEVTSPQAFEGLRLNNRKVRRPDLTFATMDHNVPTKDRENPQDEIAQKQMDALKKNCADFGIKLADMYHPDQGIVHVIGPQLGLTQPGKTIVCGDSHTSTHGAFGALAFGIGTSEVEHVFATQTLNQSKPKTMNVKVVGDLGVGVTAKDLILAIISKFGVDFGNGHVVEYTGQAVRNLTMEGRMTVCNMSIEGGARAGLISPDQTTIDFLRGRRYVPRDEAEYNELAKDWLSLATDEGAEYDTTLEIDASQIEPQVSWGTNPSMVVPISATTPSISESKDRDGTKRALEYMGLEENTPITDIEIDHVFIGSCTNSRVLDLQRASDIIKGNKVKEGVKAIVVPGSFLVKQEAEALGIDKVFIEAGFEWRNAGCSACLGMNDDQVPAGGRCASSSNRNFEGRQGNGARTHLVSPEMAAAAAINGRFVDVRRYQHKVMA
ncbi:3-isopropylmalate dehydratase large subunit [Jeotgalicoccus sp. ATCC 8456]|uniref:3-isopropylmalate dehydratase large subunit n=1 Tax=Jeotgalicoccus sp. ATCC 8456 TaxID=946435 RepID=UPI0018E5D081|nr:3-isopropylmalate dehydratase large subunit [Jeotgalicoccus sp. ATCC 8456]QQD85826.1 3-isopropylmalate dehydratase large subunit [Jeotgalicoccus sp. ATCC 8456]